MLLKELADVLVDNPYLAIYYHGKEYHGWLDQLYNKYIIEKGLGEFTVKSINVHTANDMDIELED